jgi:hypothetical protein
MSVIYTHTYFLYNNYVAFIATTVQKKIPRIILISFTTMTIYRQEATNHFARRSMSHPDLRDKAGCVSYVRQRRKHI